MRGRILVASCPLLVIAAVVACREPTQIIVDIYLRDAECSEIRTASIAITGDDTLESRLAAVTTDACDAKHIGSLAAIPQGAGSSGKIFIRVVVGFSRRVDTCTEANRYAGCTVARRRVSYRAHATTTIPVFVDKSCEDQPCATRTTCNRDRDCESADLDGLCETDTCVLPSERGPPPRGNDGASTTDATRDASTDAANEAGSVGPNGRGAWSGPGAACGPARCTAPTAICSYAGAAPQCAASGGTSYLACDESSDCNAGSTCCYNFTAQSAFCAMTTCDEELCWKDSTCPGTTICANTAASTVFGALGLCRRIGASVSIPCRLSLACTAPVQACLLNATGQHSCGAPGTSPFVSCTSREHCPSGACLLYPAGAVGAHTACGSPTGGATEVCDIANGCANGRTCSNDYVEVAYGYYLRVCR